MDHDGCADAVFLTVVMHAQSAALTMDNDMLVADYSMQHIVRQGHQDTDADSHCSIMVSSPVHIHGQRSSTHGRHQHSRSSTVVLLQ